MAWLYLVGAIVAEIAGSLALRAASHGKKRWFALVAVGYLGAFICLGLTLNAGMGLGVAYGIWTATGVALTAVFGKLIFNEPLTWTMSAGIALVVGGVLLVELGSLS